MKKNNKAAFNNVEERRMRMRKLYLGGQRWRSERVEAFYWEAVPGGCQVCGTVPSVHWGVCGGSDTSTVRLLLLEIGSSAISKTEPDPSSNQITHE